MSGNLMLAVLKRSSRTGRRLGPPATVFALAACAALVLLAGGCAGDKLIAARSQSDFQRQVLEADRPMLVEFYKGG